MFRAVQTKRFYLYTPKWNVNRLIDALIEFNEIELARMDEPRLKPAGRIKISDKQYSEALERLSSGLNEIEKIVGAIKSVEVREPYSFSLEEIDNLLREAHEKIGLLKQFPGKKDIEKIKRELEKVNTQLSTLEEEIFSSLEHLILLENWQSH